MKKLVLCVILMCLPFCNGCIAFYSYEKYHVKVVDAEANMPVDGASINIWYRLKAPYLNPARPVNVTTKPDGSATFRVADYAPAAWVVKAEGYLPCDTTGYRVPEIFSVEAENKVTIPIYREPEPKIEIVVPKGYRGPVAIHLIPSKEWIQDEIGKRLFTYRLRFPKYTVKKHNFS